MSRPRLWTLLLALAVLALMAIVPATRAARRPSATAEPSDFPPLPQPVGVVNDFAGVITTACRASIQRIADEVRAKSKGEIAVVTLRSLEGRRVEDWGLRIGRGWGVGYAGAPDDPRTNTGAIVLVAPTERRSRVELGYGAEAFIADSLAGRILDEQMLPSFRNDDFGTGILRGVNALGHEFARRFEFDLESAATECGA